MSLPKRMSKHLIGNSDLKLAVMENATVNVPRWICITGKEILGIRSKIISKNYVFAKKDISKKYIEDIDLISF